MWGGARAFPGEKKGVERPQARPGQRGAEEKAIRRGFIQCSKGRGPIPVQKVLPQNMLQSPAKSWQGGGVELSPGTARASRSSLR